MRSEKLKKGTAMRKNDLYRPAVCRVAAMVLASSIGLCATSALANGDPVNGAKLAKPCAICHTTVKDGASLIGPNLFGIVGRKAGSLAGYSYSPAMKASGLTWDEATLTKYLMAPSTVVPGTKMTYNGFQKQDDAASVAAYLATLKPIDTGAAPLPATGKVVAPQPTTGKDVAVKPLKPSNKHKTKKAHKTTSTK
jgi:cytochrome c